MFVSSNWIYAKLGNLFLAETRETSFFFFGSQFPRNNKKFEIARCGAGVALHTNTQISIRSCASQTPAKYLSLGLLNQIPQYTEAATATRGTLTSHQHRKWFSRQRRWYIASPLPADTVERETVCLSKHMIMLISCLHLPPTITGNLINNSTYTYIAHTAQGTPRSIVVAAPWIHWEQGCWMPISIYIWNSEQILIFDFAVNFLNFGF